MVKLIVNLQKLQNYVTTTPIKAAHKIGGFRWVTLSMGKQKEISAKLINLVSEKAVTRGGTSNCTMAGREY